MKYLLSMYSMYHVLRITLVLRILVLKLGLCAKNEVCAKYKRIRGCQQLIV